MRHIVSCMDVQSTLPTAATEKPLDPKRIFIRILGLARPERRALAWGTLFLAVGSVMSLVYPQAVRAIVDEALAQKNKSAVDRWALTILGVSVFQAIAASLRYYLFTLAGQRSVLRLRQQLYAHLLDQEIRFFDANRTGELMSRLSADCGVLQSAVSVNISMALRNVAGAIGGLALLIHTSPKLAMIVLLVIPPVAASAGAYGRKIREFSRRAQDALAVSMVVAEETLSGIRTVRAFAQEPYERSRYEAALAESLSAAKQSIKQVGVFMLFASLFGYGAIAGVLWYGGDLVVGGRMSVGDLTQFLLYLTIVAFSVAALAGLWGDFMSAAGAARRVFEILEDHPAIQRGGAKRLDVLRGEVEFAHVNFRYPSRLDIGVLEDLSFKLPAGQSIALVGASGSGKTTIASLLTRLYDPIDGRILIDGVDLKALDADWFRGNLGLVSQEPVLISASIAENIRYGKPSASDKELIRAAQIANAHDFITGFPEGYRTLVGERGIQLSGGQKQRVAIARAVLKDPRILILDEATSALDSESEGLVQEAITRLLPGRTTIIIAHRLATVREADRILVMDRGRIIEEGSHEDLIAREEGAYLRLVRKQFGD